MRVFWGTLMESKLNAKKLCFTYQPSSVKREVHAPAKVVNLAQSVQAVLIQNILLLIWFLHVNYNATPCFSYLFDKLECFGSKIDDNLPGKTSQGNAISLPNNKMLAQYKLKRIANNKFIVADMMISVFDRVENCMGKGENTGY